jgi:hypothetical protein
MRRWIHDAFSAWLRRVRISVAAVYVMSCINILIAMILWRYFIISKCHAYVLQSLTTEKVCFHTTQKGFWSKNVTTSHHHTFLDLQQEEKEVHQRENSLVTLCRTKKKMEIINARM